MLCNSSLKHDLLQVQMQTVVGPKTCCVGDNTPSVQSIDSGGDGYRRRMSEIESLEARAQDILERARGARGASNSAEPGSAWRAVSRAMSSVSSDNDEGEQSVLGQAAKLEVRTHIRGTVNFEKTYEISNAFLICCDTAFSTSSLQQVHFMS